MIGKHDYSNAAQEIERQPMTDYDDLTCLDDYGDDTCSGPVEYRMAISGTGRSFPRCDFHWGKALDRRDEINRRYPYHRPSDFDESYAGERWEEDY